ncbi:hypothetical protein FRC09_012436, partial [Ceratobasidium sp. 395]
MTLASLARLLGMLGLASNHSSTTCDNGDFRMPELSPNMTALACNEFGLDSVTGFLPPKVPLHRLSSAFDLWECALQRAMIVLKRPGDCEDPPATEDEKAQSREWRDRIEQ